MPKRQFREVVMDREKRLFCIVREVSTDDTELSTIVSEMRELDMPIHCDTPEISRSVEAVIAGWKAQGYTFDTGLYSRALEENAGGRWRKSGILHN